MQAGPIHHRLGLHHGPDPNHRPNLRVRQSRFVHLTPETKLHMLSLVQLFIIINTIELETMHRTYLVLVE